MIAVFFGISASYWAGLAAYGVATVSLVAVAGRRRAEAEPVPEAIEPELVDRLPARA